jgi:hypothetical protein
VQVAGRTFDVGRVLSEAAVDLAHALARAARQILRDDYARNGVPCAVAALVGGGAALVGAHVTQQLQSAELGLQRIITAEEPGWAVVRGAQM